MNWWLQALHDRDPRPVPINEVLRRRPVITYSDGEGSDAGVGVVLFTPDNEPQANLVYLQVPDGLRQLWRF